MIGIILAASIHLQGPPVLYEGHFAFTRGRVRDKKVIIDKCVPIEEAMPFATFCGYAKDELESTFCFSTGVASKDRCESIIKQNIGNKRSIAWIWSSEQQ